MKSINPYTLEILAEWPLHTPDEIEKILLSAQYHSFNRELFKEKANRLSILLLEHRIDLAKLISSEMGKPLTQSLQEIDKCAWCCKYYAEHAAEFLKDEYIETEYKSSFIRYEAVGVWLAIMPWNFPFWQVFRCAIPALAAGNNFILKHASNVQMCAHKMEELFHKAGFESFAFQNIRVAGEHMHDIIQHPIVKGISFTGSEIAGAKVGAIAGGEIKPVVLELGGSNAFIVTHTADIKRAVDDVLIGRFQNNGQSCIAAKRVLVESSVYEEFLMQLLTRVSSVYCGDPLHENTFIGPLAKAEFNEEVMRQVEASVSEGAKIEYGGVVENGIFQPTVLTNVNTAMTCMREEIFGPVLPVYRFDKIEEAIEVSNSTAFGLGVSIYGSDTEYLKSIAHKFEEGAVFINSIVKSDPRLPFGGAKRSGLGRELGKAGLLEFVNIKTIVIAE